MTDMDKQITEGSKYKGDASELCPHPWAAVGSLLIGFFMLMIDISIVSVANPSIQRGLGASLTETIWVTSAYLLGLAAPLLISGRLGDRFGQRNMFFIGMAVFTAASLACGLAPSAGVLIAARAVQGVGGSFMSPQSQATIVKIFPPHRRGAAMGLWGSVSGVAMLVGPMLGGFLVQGVGWQSIFLINVPVGVVGLILVARFVPKFPTNRPRLDWTGVLLSGAGIFFVVFGLQEGSDIGWGPIWGPVTIIDILIAGVALLAAFVFWQTRARNPLVPLGLFRTRDFSLANSAIFLVGMAVTSMSLPLMYFIQVGRGLDPLLSAIFMIPSAVVGAVLAPFVGRSFVAKFGANRVACFGLAAFAAGLIAYTTLFTPTSNIWLLLIPGVVLGLGNGCMWSPIAMSATHQLPLSQAGVGAGVYNTVRQIGSALGSALMTVLMNTLLTAHNVNPAILQQNVQGAPLASDVAASFSRAMAGALWLPAGVALAGAVIAAFLSGRAGRRAASDTNSEGTTEPASSNHAPFQ